MNLKKAVLYIGYYLGEGSKSQVRVLKQRYFAHMLRPKLSPNHNKMYSLNQYVPIFCLIASIN